eukprot:6919435-Alexandrium_andersonii.AAC.1
MAHWSSVCPASKYRANSSMYARAWAKTARQPRAPAAASAMAEGEKQDAARKPLSLRLRRRLPLSGHRSRQT